MHRRPGRPDPHRGQHWLAIRPTTVAAAAALEAEPALDHRRHHRFEDRASAAPLPKAGRRAPQPFPQRSLLDIVVRIRDEQGFQVLSRSQGVCRVKLFGIELIHQFIDTRLPTRPGMRRSALVAELGRRIIATPFSDSVLIAADASDPKVAVPTRRDDEGTALLTVRAVSVTVRSIGGDVAAQADRCR